MYVCVYIQSVRNAEVNLLIAAKLPNILIVMFMLLYQSERIQLA